MLLVGLPAAVVVCDVFTARGGYSAVPGFAFQAISHAPHNVRE